MRRLGKTSAATLLALLSVAVMLLTGCGGTTTATGPAKASDDKQILHAPLVTASTDIRRLDPARITDLYSFTVANNVFPSLVTLDKNLNVIPWAITAMPTVSTDGLTYTFKIRSGLKWTDGTAIDAAAFAYGINRSLDPCTGSGAASYLYAIKGATDFNSGTCDFAGDKTAATANPVSTTSLITKSIVVTDPQTLAITLEKPYQWFLPALVTSVAFAQPKQLIEKYGRADWGNHLAELGFGGSMFNVTLWDHKGNLELTRNEGFWGQKPVLKKIVYKIYKDSETMYADYQNNTIDVGGCPSSQYAQCKLRPEIKEHPYLDISYDSPNWKKAPFDDVRARQAFALALDKVALNHVQQDIATPTNHIIPDGMPFYNASLKGPDGTNNLTGNADKAKALITDYAKDKCGGDVTKCPKVTYYGTNTPSGQADGEAHRQMWAKNLAGYPVEIKYVSFNDLIDVVYGGDPPQLFGIGWIVDYPDPEDWLSLQFDPASTTNTTFVNDPTGTDLMTKCDTTSDKAQRTKFCNDAEQEMVTQVAWIPLSQAKATTLSHGNIQGYVTASTGYPTVDNWQAMFISK